MDCRSSLVTKDRQVHHPWLVEETADRLNICPWYARIGYVHWTPWGRAEDRPSMGQWT